MQEIKPALHPKTCKQMKDEGGNLLFTFNAAAASRALELIGKHVEVAAFKERLEVNGEGQSLPLTDHAICRLHCQGSESVEGQKGDINWRRSDVCFWGKSGHRSTTPRLPLIATSGHENANAKTVKDPRSLSPR